jgi:hypothetical protein
MRTIYFGVRQPTWSYEMIRIHRLTRVSGNRASDCLGRIRRRFRPQTNVLEGRLLLALSVVGESVAPSYVGVGFSLNPVAEIGGTYSNGQPDNNLSDYQVQIDWGDGGSPDASASLVALGNGLVLVKGSHIYKEQGTYDIAVYVTGPDGQTASTAPNLDAVATASPMPDASSQPITVPTAYSGSQPLGDETLSVVGESVAPSYV